MLLCCIVLLCIILATELWVLTLCNKKPFVNNMLYIILDCVTLHCIGYWVLSTDPLQQETVLYCLVWHCIVLYWQLTLCKKRPPPPTKQCTSSISAKPSSLGYQHEACLDDALRREWCLVVCGQLDVFVLQWCALHLSLTSWNWNQNEISANGSDSRIMGRITLQKTFSWCKTNQSNS